MTEFIVQWGVRRRFPKSVDGSDARKEFRTNHYYIGTVKLVKTGDTAVYACPKGMLFR